MSDNTIYVYNIVATSSLSGTFGSAWDENVSQSVVNDALLDYGVATEAEMSNEKKRKTLLKYYTWGKIVDMLIMSPVEYKTDGEGFKFDRKSLEARLARAKIDAMPYLSLHEITQGRMTFPDDPYSIDGQIEHNA